MNWFYKTRNDLKIDFSHSRFIWELRIEWICWICCVVEWEIKIKIQILLSGVIKKQFEWAKDRREIYCPLLISPSCSLLFRSCVAPQSFSLSLNNQLQACCHRCINFFISTFVLMEITQFEYFFFVISFNNSFKKSGERQFYW